MKKRIDNIRAIASCRNQSVFFFIISKSQNGKTYKSTWMWTAWSNFGKNKIQMNNHLIIKTAIYVNRNDQLQLKSWRSGCITDFDGKQIPESYNMKLETQQNNVCTATDARVDYGMRETEIFLTPGCRITWTEFYNKELNQTWVWNISMIPDWELLM